MEERNTSPGSDTSSQPSANSPGTGETTEAFLERVSSLLALAWEGSLGARSAELMRLYMSPDFTNQAHNLHESPFPYSPNLEHHMAALNALRQVNPSWRTACFNFTASVHQESEHAVVWFTSGTSGDPGNAGDWKTNRESVSKLYWRKKEKKNSSEWECYSHECIRGPGDAL